MLYRIDPTARTAKSYVEPHTRSRVPCRTGREMRALYPAGGFLIVGEIGCCGPPAPDGDVLLTRAGAAIPIYPRGSLTRPWEWVVGYVPMEGSAYAAAVSSLWPAAFRRAGKTGNAIRSAAGRQRTKKSCERIAKRGLLFCLPFPESASRKRFCH